MPVIERYKPLSVLPQKGLTGRRQVTTNQRVITPENVIEVVHRGIKVHRMNEREMHYLYDYYRGCQDIRYKRKCVREEINNKVTVNRASEIVSFKTAYLLGAPIQYVSSGATDDSVSEQIVKLNELMRYEDKKGKDEDLADWVHICGVGVRIVLADEPEEEFGSPATIHVPAPWEAFVIYNSGIAKKPLCGVVIQYNDNDEEYYSVYTKDFYCEIMDGDFITPPTPHLIGRIPVIEYVNNNARMGAFEPVISILNEINKLESHRADGVEDFVNSYDVFQNCEIDKATYRELSSGGGAIKIKTVSAGMDARVYRISSEISQQGVQTAIDDLYHSVLTICGMPNRNGGRSTSDTGTAVIYRDGFAEAESRARATEEKWKQSEREFLRVFLSICNNVVVENDEGEYESMLDLKLSDVETEFTRGHFEGLQTKVNVLTQMLGTDDIHPRLAFQTSGVFTDADAAYQMSQEYKEEQSKAEEERLKKELENVRNSGQDDASSSDEDSTEVPEIEKAADQ